MEICAYKSEGMCCYDTECLGKNESCPIYTPKGHTDDFIEMFSLVTPRQATYKNGLEGIYDKNLNYERGVKR